MDRRLWTTGLVAPSLGPSSRLSYSRTLGTIPNSSAGVAHTLARAQLDAGRPGHGLAAKRLTRTDRYLTAPACKAERQGSS